MMKVPAPLISCFLCASALFTPVAFADDPHAPDQFQVDLSLSVMNEGTLDLEDDQLLGVEFKYFFSPEQLSFGQNQHPFVSFGLQTDMDNEGANINLYHLDLGSQYEFGSLWGSRTYLEYSLGALYTQTDYSFQLLDRETSHNFSELTYKASLGLGVDFHEDMSSKLSLSRFGDSTMLGLSIGYKF